MNSLIVIGVVLLVALSSAESVIVPPPERCATLDGRCYDECPAGTRRYSIGCGYKTPEATCAQPNPVPETAMICDYSACYCIAPTVRDENIDQCVLPENCSPLIPKPGVLIPPPEDCEE